MLFTVISWKLTPCLSGHSYFIESLSEIMIYSEVVHSFNHSIIHYLFFLPSSCIYMIHILLNPFCVERI